MSRIIAEMQSELIRKRHLRTENGIMQIPRRRCFLSILQLAARSIQYRYYYVENALNTRAEWRKIMANKNAKKALEQFKMQAANEVGVNLNQGYNGDLTARQAGSIGGQMVKKMIESYENSLSNGSAR